MVSGEDIAKSIMREKISRHMKAVPLTLAEAALRVGHDQRNFDRMLKGYSAASLERLQSTAERLGVEFNRTDIIREAEAEALQVQKVDGELDRLLEGAKGRPVLERMSLLRTHLIEHASRGGSEPLSPSARDAITRVATLKASTSATIICEYNDEGLRFVKPKSGEIAHRSITISDDVYRDFTRLRNGEEGLLIKQVVDLLDPAADQVIDSLGKCIWIKYGDEWRRTDTHSEYRDPFTDLNERLLARYRARFGLSPRIDKIASD